MSIAEAPKPPMAEVVALDRRIELRDARLLAARFLGRYTNRHAETGTVTIREVPASAQRYIEYAHAFNVTANSPMQKPLPAIAEVSVVDFEMVRANLNKEAEHILAPIFGAMVEMGASLPEQLR